MKQLSYVIVLLVLVLMSNALFCEESAIEPGLKSVLFKVGPVPMVYIDRGDVTGVVVQKSDPKGDPIVNLGKVARFNDQFTLPFILCFEIGYALNSFCEIFGEFAYKHAAGKSLQDRLGSFATQRFGNFNAFEGFGGFRIFTQDALCEDLWPFIGSKIGVIHHSGISAVFEQADRRHKIQYFAPDNVVAGGLQAGFMYKLGSNWSFVFTAEMVAVGNTESEQEIRIPDNSPDNRLGFLFLNIDAVSTVLTFPITFALRYDF